MCAGDYHQWEDEARFHNYEYGILTPNAMEFRRLWIRYILQSDVNQYEQSNSSSRNKDEYLPPMDTSDLLSSIVSMNDSSTDEKVSNSNDKQNVKIVDGRCYLCEDFLLLSWIADTSLLAKTLGLTILRKGAVDIISDGKYFVVSSNPITLRRCGGQGDVLAGTVGAWVHWTRQYAKENKTKDLPSVGVIAAFAGSYLLRHFAAQAFELKHRSTLTTDIIERIPEVMETLFPTNAKL